MQLIRARQREYLVVLLTGCKNLGRKKELDVVGEPTVTEELNQYCEKRSGAAPHNGCTTSGDSLALPTYARNHKNKIKTTLDEPIKRCLGVTSPPHQNRLDRQLFGDPMWLSLSLSFTHNPRSSSSICLFSSVQGKQAAPQGCSVCFHSRGLVSSVMGESRQCCGWACVKFRDPQNSLVVVACGTLVLLFLQVVIGVRGRSLAILADLPHGIADFIGVAIGSVMERHKEHYASFDFYGGVIQTAIIVASSMWAIREALGRLDHPRDDASFDDVGTAMLAFSVLSLLSNLAFYLLLDCGSSFESNLSLSACFFSMVHGPRCSCEDSRFIVRTDPENVDADECVFCIGSGGFRPPPPQRNFNVDAAKLHFIADLLSRIVMILVAGAIVAGFVRDPCLADTLTTLVVSVCTILGSIYIWKKMWDHLMTWRQ